MITLGSALDSHIFYAHQQLKRARSEEDFAGVALWMFRIDELLDRRGHLRAEALDELLPEPSISPGCQGATPSA